jgi:uncharacterized membrane protein YdjX (TVP38/TMEM64 family)
MAKRLRYYFAGFAIGTLLGLLVSYLIGKHNLLWISTCGNLCGILIVAWAQHSGLAPTPEEVNRPLSLFTPVERHEQEPKR